MGKLIVFEGIDGSGKSTQFRLLCDRLRKDGITFQNLTFPQYEEPSSTLIRMYLSGEFGDDPGLVNPYAASSFFAVDRYASYTSKWGSYYREGGVIITDRYTTSNAIHQASKLSGNARKEYFQWLYDYEFMKMGMPSPDLVIYLHTPMDVCIHRMRVREQITNTSADIHEKNNAYLKTCYKCGLEAASFYNWTIIDSMDGKRELSVEQISEQIYKTVCAELAAK